MIALRIILNIIKGGEMSEKKKLFYSFIYIIGCIMLFVIMAYIGFRIRVWIIKEAIRESPKECECKAEKEVIND